jgi:hypothetical protein
MTTNIYLDSLLSPVCKSYGGCFSADNIPPLDAGKEQNIIVNLSKVSEEGSHFVALIMKSDYIFYFDSFGEKCITPHILEYMSRHTGNVFYNAIQVQHHNSKMCGFYCALIIMRNDCNFKLNSDMAFYTKQKDLHLNDDLCVKYICQTIDKLTL